MVRNLVLLSALALLAAGCERKANAPAAKPSAATAAAPVSASPAPTASVSAATASTGGARTTEEETSLFNFSYSYPAQAGAIPALKALLDADADKQRAELIGQAKQGRAAMKEAGFDYNPYDRQTAWQLVTDLPGWLSLSASMGSYAGGAHPNHWFDALLWDKGAGRRREASDLFRSKAALSQAIRQDFCREIDKQREAKRGEPVDRSADAMFSECIDPVENTIILGSSNRKSFDRIGVLVAPYQAGPYVEGDYEVTLPVTAAVLAAVKPEFRANFAVQR
jgi:Deacetylase PdaC